MLRFHHFHVPVAAVRLGTLTLVSPFPLVTLTDAMRSLDVSHFVNHVTPDVSVSRDSGSAYSYVFHSRLT